MHVVSYKIMNRGQIANWGIMELSYVVQLDVKSRQPGQKAALLLTRHVASWITQISDTEVSSNDFSGVGNLELGEVGPAGAKAKATVNWHEVQTDRWLALRINLSQGMPDSKTIFVTSITIAEIDQDRTTFRIALGKDAVSDVLAPAEQASIYVPGILGNALRDSNLAFSALGQRVDTSFSKIDSDEKLSIVLDALRQPRKLPILVIDTVNKEKLGLAKMAVRPLVGMAQVLCLPANSFINRFNMHFPEYAIPYSGARLIWPNVEARANYFDSEDLDSHEKVIEQLKRILFRASAFSRNWDSQWVAAQNLARDFELRKKTQEFEANLQRVQSQGNKDEEIELLTELLAETTAELRTLRHEHDAYISEFGKLEDVEAQLRIQESQTAYWMELANSKQLIGEPTWDEVPDCSDGNFDSLFEALERVSGGALVFTSNARRSWNQDQRPEVETMQTVLKRLASAAVEWRSADSRVGESIDRWLQSRLGKIVPMQDKTLENLGLANFEFDGATHRRTPHVKVKDATDPSRVARIYFAIDHSNLRIIVDHVGLKLYGR